MKRRLFEITILLLAGGIAGRLGWPEPGAPLVTHHAPVLGGWVFPWWEAMWAAVYASLIWGPWG